jgi:hypothetical protein
MKEIIDEFLQTMKKLTKVLHEGCNPALVAAILVLAKVIRSRP